MKDLIILDTHVILWSGLEPEELSKEIRQKISLAQEENRLAICSISLWEIAMLTFKKRINIYQPVKDFLKTISDIEGLTIKDISPEIAAESAALIDNFHGDPADRIIAATAKIYGATLLTRDKKLLDWAKLGNIKFMTV
jgi:PIN domain nuclease of toxin-antitoxin system